MRSSAFLFAALFAVTLFAAPASFALSIDNETGLNTDGTAKFSDPDDTMPNFMTSPDGSSSPQAQPSVTLPMSSPSSGGPTFSFSGGSLGQSPQQDAFDHAYAHFGN